MRDRREYHKKYYADNKARLAKMKSDRHKTDLDYRLRAILRTIDQRCNDPRHTSYRWYGGKNIKNELTFDMLKFMWKRDGADHMKKASIDRTDPDKNYSFGNCFFRELKENQKRGWEDKASRTKAIRDGMKKHREARKRQPAQAVEA